MAEYGAHLVTSISERPSIFEVLAQESLSVGLRNAFRYLASVLTEHYPSKLGFLHQHFEEIVTACDIVVQLYHLKTYNGSFAEHFYGLKRVTAFPENSRLTKKHLLKSLAILVLVPYIKNKLDSLYERLRHDEASGRLDDHQGARSSKVALILLYLKLYPIMYFTWEGLNLYNHFLYAVGKSKVHSVSLALASVELVTLTQDDYLSFEKSQFMWENDLRWYNIPKCVLLQGMKWCMDGLSSGLMTGAFFLQFLDWWYSRQVGSTSFAPLPIPPPPPKLKSTDIKDGTCPLCSNVRTNDTVLSVSGFVFCYPCIHRFLTEKSCCPVTGYPATLNDLVRIF